ncbi:MAG TPA: hypothetical protein VGN97_22020 [Mesorhizobium sp.]|jgi:hypothetical protein|nr:hypothetical protein [Mesorhizobium sp.]
MAELDRKGVITPEELTLLSRAFSRVTVELGLDDEAERNGAAAQLIHLFERGERNEDGLVRLTVHLSAIQRGLAGDAPLT